MRFVLIKVILSWYLYIGHKRKTIESKEFQEFLEKADFSDIIIDTQENMGYIVAIGKK